jgi:hypothetical protein
MQRTRRDFLTATGSATATVTAAVTATATAGCGGVAVSTEPPTVTLNEIVLVNLHDEPHLFDVLVRDVADDEVVFWERYRAAAATESEEGWLSTGSHRWDDPLDEPGHYAVYAAADREVPERDSRWSSVELTGKRYGDNVGIDVQVDRQGFLAVLMKPYTE